METASSSSFFSVPDVLTPVPLTVFNTDKPPAGISFVSQWSEASRQLLEVRDSMSRE